MIKFPYYRVNVTFPDDNSDNQLSKPYIGDVKFKYIWKNESFSEEETSLRAIYLIFSTIAIFIFWLKMRKIVLEDWTIEQYSVAGLLLSLIALNSMYSCIGIEKKKF